MITTTTISNTAAFDLPLSKQEELGICDWRAEVDNGRVAFGHSEGESLSNLRRLVKQSKEQEMETSD